MQKNKIYVVLLLCTLMFRVYSQNKTPYVFKLQDKFAKKTIRKYLEHDTLLKTSGAIIHISYSSQLNKPYLLLIHGMGGNARTTWSSQIKELSKSFNLILPDLIYFGESTSLSGNYSVEFQVEQIHEAISKLGINQPINVLGFSYGGLTAAIYNQLFQSSVKKLIIMDGPVKFFSAEMADSIANSVGIKGLNNIISPTTIEGFSALQKLAVSSEFKFSKRIRRKIINYYFLPYKEVRDKQMNYLIDKKEYYQSLNYNLDKTTTLLIWGGRDGVIPISVGNALHNAYPTTTQMVVFPKAKHDAHFKATKKFNKAVINFFLN